MPSVTRYELKNFYKGTFLKYCNDNYLDDIDYRAYISIPDLILSNPSANIVQESISTSNIINRDELNVEKTIKSVNALICKPLFINKFLPFLNENDTVFVFLINSDPKKIFYVPISNDYNKQNKLSFSIDKNSITMDKDEIVIERKHSNDIHYSITLSERGIELVGPIYANGNNVTTILNPSIGI